MPLKLLRACKFKQKFNKWKGRKIFKSERKSAREAFSHSVKLLRASERKETSIKWIKLNEKLKGENHLISLLSRKRIKLRIKKTKKVNIFT